MKIYRDYTQEELDRQYEHRHFVADVETFVVRARDESRRVRAAAKGRFDVAYGASPDELLDIYLADVKEPAPIIVFYHGGRWSRGGKAASCEGAEAFTMAGAHFISVNFTLLPHVTMDILIQQCRDAIAWIWRNAATFGGDRDRLYITGKSSGAHIGGMMVTTDWKERYGLPADIIKAGLLISGMYDLEPVRLTFRNDFLKLDRDSAARNSPILHIPDNGCPLVIGCGSLETPEFRRQTKEFADAWRAKGLRCQYLEVPDRHHYSVSIDMKSSPLVELMLEEMKLAPSGAES